MLMKTEIAPADIPSLAERLRAGGQWLRQHILLMIAVPLGLSLAVVWATYYFTSGRTGSYL
jgi:hypothetical protein